MESSFLARSLADRLGKLTGDYQSANTSRLSEAAGYTSGFMSAEVAAEDLAAIDAEPSFACGSDAQYQRVSDCNFREAGGPLREMVVARQKFLDDPSAASADEFKATLVAWACVQAPEKDVRGERWTSGWRRNRTMLEKWAETWLNGRDPVEESVAVLRGGVGRPTNEWGADQVRTFFNEVRTPSEPWSPRWFRAALLFSVAHNATT